MGNNTIIQNELRNVRKLTVVAYFNIRYQKLLEGQRKTTKILSQDIRSSDKSSNPGSPEYEARVLINTLQHLVLHWKSCSFLTKYAYSLGAANKEGVVFLSGETLCVVPGLTNIPKSLHHHTIKQPPHMISLMIVTGNEGAEQNGNKKRGSSEENGGKHYWEGWFFEISITPRNNLNLNPVDDNLEPRLPIGNIISKKLCLLASSFDFWFHGLRFNYLLAGIKLNI